ncbi:hypothetical protein AB0B21_17260 [Streptomyces rimosus]|uniref:hypothetical protein n=1 Tax=Streptomyces rimosus TaxID=1927 RepID=UPI00131B8C4C|nr:hypothetical protein [Streptomyces rimosus]
MHEGNDFRVALMADGDIVLQREAFADSEEEFESEALQLLVGVLQRREKVVNVLPGPVFEVVSHL